MSYKMLFCLGVTTLLATSFIPATAARAITKPTANKNFPLNSVNYDHQQYRLSLGVTTLLATSFIPATAARAITKPTANKNFPLNSVNYDHQQYRLSFKEDKVINFGLASEETKSSGVPQDSSRPPRG